MLTSLVFALYVARRFWTPQTTSRVQFRLDRTANWCQNGIMSKHQFEVFFVGARESGSKKRVCYSEKVFKVNKTLELKLMLIVEFSEFNLYIGSLLFLKNWKCNMNSHIISLETIGICVYGIAKKEFLVDGVFSGSITKHSATTGKLSALQLCEKWVWDKEKHSTAKIKIFHLLKIVFFSKNGKYRSKNGIFTNITILLFVFQIKFAYFPQFSIVF